MGPTLSQETGILPWSAGCSPVGSQLKSALPSERPRVCLTHLQTPCPFSVAPPFPQCTDLTMLYNLYSPSYQASPDGSLAHLPAAGGDSTTEENEESVRNCSCSSLPASSGETVGKACSISCQATNLNHSSSCNVLHFLEDSYWSKVIIWGPLLSLKTQNLKKNQLHLKEKKKSGPCSFRFKF